MAQGATNHGGRSKARESPESVGPCRVLAVTLPAPPKALRGAYNPPRRDLGDAGGRTAGRNSVPTGRQGTVPSPEVRGWCPAVAARGDPPRERHAPLGIDAREYALAGGGPCGASGPPPARARRTTGCAWIPRP